MYFFPGEIKYQEDIIQVAIICDFSFETKLLGLCYRNITTIATVGLTEAKI